MSKQSKFVVNLKLSFQEYMIMKYSLAKLTEKQLGEELWGIKNKLDSRMNKQYSKVLHKEYKDFAEKGIK